MGYREVQQLSKYVGMVASGMVAGAISTGVAVQLPMLIEATWAEQASHIRFDSRTIQQCEVNETEKETINLL
jgi:hypothetical protein